MRSPHPNPTLILAALAALGGIVFGAISPLEAAEKVSIEGLQSVSTGQARIWIASQIEFVESAGVSRARADDLAFFLENAMRERGYSDATVNWSVEGEGDSARILLTASEGNSVVLGAISVEGNVALEDAAVIELLTATTMKRLKKEPGETLPYVKEDIEQGRAKVIAFYKLLGFRNAEVHLDKKVEGTRSNLFVTVSEGTEARVGKITFPDSPSPELTPAFAEIGTEFTGKTYSGSIPQNLASRVRSAAVNAGFYHAKVSADEVEGGVFNGNDQVDLVVTAEWGGSVELSGLRVHGNEKVNSSFFDRHFAKLVDRPYSPAEANRAVNELLQSGAFETVRTDVVSQEDGTYLLDVEVEEGYSRTLGIYGGFTNYEGPLVGFEFRNLNLFGNVRKIDSMIELSQRGARGQVDYTDPWFLDSSFEFSGGLFALNRAEDGYEKFQTGGRYEFSRRFGRKRQDSITIFGEAAYTDVHDAEIAPIYLGDTEYFSHQLGFSLSHDRRDDPRRPRKGYIAQASFSAASSAIGSEVEYLKATGRLGYYLPVGEHTLRLGARAGAISPTGDTDDIPIDLRYFNGGPFSVRSFQERSMGLRDPGSGYAVGGNFYTVFNAEYEIPLPMVNGLSFVPFADAGNVTYDESAASLDDLRYALGLGLRYETPIGPLRAEYGYNPDQRPGEPQGTFHIGFGLGY